MCSLCLCGFVVARGFGFFEKKKRGVVYNSEYCNSYRYDADYNTLTCIIHYSNYFNLNYRIGASRQCANITMKHLKNLKEYSESPLPSYRGTNAKYE